MKAVVFLVAVVLVVVLWQHASSSSQACGNGYGDTRICSTPYVGPGAGDEHVPAIHDVP